MSKNQINPLMANDLELTTWSTGCRPKAIPQ